MDDKKEKEIPTIIAAMEISGMGIANDAQRDSQGITMPNDFPMGNMGFNYDDEEN